MAEMAANGEIPDVLFWVGCAGSYDQRAQKITKAFATILHKVGIRYAILGKEELCTGDPARRAGNEFMFQMMAYQNIQILNDTVIEVVMIVDKKMQAIIRTNALVSIGTDGLVGNKVVNMVPSKVSAPLAKEGAILLVKRAVSPDEMLQTLYTTNNDIAVIAANLKMTVQRINTSNAIWTLLSDPYIPNDLKLSIAKIREATSKAASITNNLDEMIVEVKNGKGLLGMILTDDTLANNFGNVVLKINSVGEQLDTLSGEIRGLVNNFNQDLNKGKGPFNTLLRDSMLSIKLSNSLDNIQQGTDGFNQNMAAIKHSFLLRGYFKKMRKKE